MEVTRLKAWTQKRSISELLITPNRTTRPGWYELHIRFQDDPLVLANPYLTLQLAPPGEQEPRLIPLSIVDDGLRVIFHAPAPIASLRLHISPSTLPTSSFTINIQRRMRSHALWRIMRHISLRDKALGIDPERIFRKSHVRYKKHGYEGFLQRLLKEYHLADMHLISETDIYQAWIVRNEASLQSAREQRLDALTQHPKISVIMATWKSDLRWLKAAIHSVQAQSYPHWELCIADDASNMPALTRLLKQAQAEDPRIKIILRSENGHISAAQNSALQLAHGDYITFLDHDDLLSIDALLHVAEALQTEERPRFLYSDEDKIDGLGRRNTPHFKSDWNPDLLRSQNYITHLMVVEHQLLKEIGGFRIGLEGSQDHDLALRALERLPSSAIKHIPHILYHWRITENSTALHAGAKDYTESASIQALNDHFQRTGQSDVRVERGELPNTYRVRYPIPNPAPLVSLLIPTRDKLEVLRPCVNSILDKTSYPRFEIIILDNGSIEKCTLDYFVHIQESDARVRVLRYNLPFNYSAINNFGVQHAKGEVLGLINNDVEVISPDWLSEMVSHALREEIGCVGAKLYFTDHTIQHAGVILGIGGVAGHAHKYFPGEAYGYFSRLKLVQNLSAVTGACLVVRKSIYQQVAGLDEDHLSVAFNDVDLCLKVREAGYRNLWTPYAELFHHESKSRGAENTPEKQARFQSEVLWMQERWKDQLPRDPYYSPNLTLEHEDFSIRLYQ
ncbi:MAG: glycosyltransferase family 2 protein [Pseudomonadota bacterium]